MYREGFRKDVLGRNWKRCIGNDLKKTYWKGPPKCIGKDLVKMYWDGPPKYVLMDLEDLCGWT
eukprot:5282158-Karenia_brevis.AAC.1